MTMCKVFRKNKETSTLVGKKVKTGCLKMVFDTNYRNCQIMHTHFLRIDSTVRIVYNRPLKMSTTNDGAYKKYWSEYIKSMNVTCFLNIYINIFGKKRKNKYIEELFGNKLVYF